MVLGSYLSLSVGQESEARSSDHFILFNRREIRNRNWTLLQVFNLGYRKILGTFKSLYLYNSYIYKYIQYCIIFFSDCKVKEPSAAARNPELAKKLWETSIEMVGLKDYDMFNCSGDALPEPLKDV